MERETLIKMYELERAKVIILMQTRGEYSDTSLETFFNFLIDNEIKRDYLECAYFVKDYFITYLTEEEMKIVSDANIFYFLVVLINKSFKDLKNIKFLLTNTCIKIENKDEVKEQLRELSVDIENLKLRSDIDKILYILLSE